MPDGVNGSMSHFAPSAGVEAPLLMLIVQHSLVRDWLTCWLDHSFAPLRSTAVADVASADALGTAAAVIIYVDDPTDTNAWMAQQIASLRADYPVLPIVLLGTVSNALLHRMNVQGHISMSMKTAIAKAALGLILVGGTYLPQSTAPISDGEAISEPPPVANLTRREQHVLDELSLGMQNKLIAHKLGMSLSTVKAHVHSIIMKLKVNNRTEAVVTARTMNAERAVGNPGCLTAA